MKNKKKALIFLLVLLVVWFLIRFVIGGSEDSWVCVEGQWVRHGYPSAPMPQEKCDN